MGLLQDAKRPAEASQEPGQTSLTPGSIFHFWFPLALSWLLMGVEGPLAIGVISRMANPVANSAAYLILIGLNMWIESPVIDLLATSTTLSKDQGSYRQLTKFTWWMIVWVTFIQALVSLSPLFHVVTVTLLGIPEPVANLARPGMILLIPWSGLIGWRRNLQGILIRFGQTRAIGFGTLCRAATMAIIALALLNSTKLPSVIVASTAILASVFAEAMFVQWVSRRTIKERFSIPSIGPSLRSIAAFHLPLTLTTMVNLVATPIVAAGLARTEDSVSSLAGFAVCSTILFICRSVTFCLPEVVITLFKDDRSRIALYRFCIAVGLAASGSILAMAISGTDRLIFSHVLGASPRVVENAHACFLFASAIPLLDAIHSYLRGLLTRCHQTRPRIAAVAAGTLGLIVALAVGLGLHLSGPVLAAVSISTSVGFEVGVLAFAWARVRHRLTDGAPLH